ncbi:type VI secretion system ATPase TssH [Escherichia coli]|uniref:type VI secretion system ATPase TssH n=1 Tax=Escherichia coli TaxID=562 RepID=UPI00191A1BA2|nr:type VI secretion system ATPase TssH [Escherichia coli]UMS57106.1 type VI secretion system ATPase TssH [Escherichia coli]CAD5736218.1 ATP-dependent Clp proteinase Aec27 ATP-binding chain, with chaperone activity [Escherichia coli]
MIQIDLATLVKRLNPFAKQALEMAASECMSQQASEITVAHVLLQMLAIPRNDVRVIAERTGISAEDLRQALTVDSYPGGRSAEGYPSFSPMLIEWLKESWLLASAQMQHSELRSGVLLLTLLHSPLRYIPPAAARLLTAINRDQLQQDFAAWTKESAESVDLAGGQTPRATETGDTLLARYAKNMTADARNGRLDPVLCRDYEIDLMIDILCRRRKNNPVVVGEAGVGKSALIEGLALRIVAGLVPDKLKNTDIMTLDLGALQAGASVKGEFEKRFNGLMAEVIFSPVPVILFIDEAHTLIGAGNQQGGLDISNLLKPALARGELKTIAATTWSEYKKYFEKDAALSRRFQLVKVSEPNAAEATIILRGLSAVYEQSHGVLIDDDALQAAATLSERYLSGRQLPDKAIDVLDTACARVAINLSSPPKQISALTTLSHQQEAEIRQLERELRIGLRTDTSRMTEVLEQYDETLSALDELEVAWQQQQTLVQEIIALRQQLLGVAEDDVASLPDADAVEDTPPEAEQDSTDAESADDAGSVQPEETAETVSPVQRLAQLTAELDALHNDQLLVSPHVDKKQIAAVIAEWTGVPLNRLSQNEMSVITDLPVWLGGTIKGQDLAIASLHKHLLTARADLRRPGRPLGAFLLAGPSGVGKTETVLQLAELLYGGRQYLTTINMSEFQEKHTVSRLIGSPPGYVGYGEGGVLTEAIRQKPYSVVLLDEVEKAHPDVLNLFYQAFDKGEMADGEGRLIDCKNIVFFLTSNLGYQVIVEHADDPETMQEALYPVLADFFKPALLARMEVVPYLPLSKETLATIIAGKLARLDNVLRSRFGADVIIGPEVTDEIMSRVTRAENGARMLESVIDGDMLPPLSLLLLQKMAANTAIARIRLSAADGAFTADVEDALPDDAVTPRTEDETVL